VLQIYIPVISAIVVKFFYCNYPDLSMYDTESLAQCTYGVPIFFSVHLNHRPIHANILLDGIKMGANSIAEKQTTQMGYIMDHVRFNVSLILGPEADGVGGMISSSTAIADMGGLVASGEGTAAG